MNAPLSTHPTPPYKHTPLFPLGKDPTPYRKIADGVRVERVMGEEVLVVPREALRALAEAAFTDINHLLRPAHLASLKHIVEDPEASDNDKFVAYDFLKNANIAAGGVLPMCQDTGTAIVMGKKGRLIWTDGDDEAALAEGARDAYLKRNLRYSQLAPISMFEEKNTRSNMPAQVELYAESHNPDHAEADAAYKFLFIAKGGGSANKAFLFQATPSILTRERLLAFLKEKVLTLGTAACPPYHLAIVIGGTSAEADDENRESSPLQDISTLCPIAAPKTATPFATWRWRGNSKMTQSLGIGAQFGGKYFCHDVRVIRLPRHGASLPIGLGVSCSADRKALGKITATACFSKSWKPIPNFLASRSDQELGSLRFPSTSIGRCDEICRELSQVPHQDPAVAQRILGGGARRGARAHPANPGRRRSLPESFREPSGRITRVPRKPPTGSLRQFRTHHGRPHGRLCRRVPWPAAAPDHVGQGQPFFRRCATRAKNTAAFTWAPSAAPRRSSPGQNILKVEVLDFAELGMEAIRRIEVKNFPAFIVIDDKGNDFFKELNLG